MSARLLFNVTDQHLRRGLRHAEKCRDRCVAGCGFAELDDWLEGPVTAAEAETDRRIKQRLAELGVRHAGS